MAMFSKVGVFLIGLVAGGFFIALMYIAFLYQIDTFTDLVTILFALGFGICSGILTVVLFPYSFPVVTSLIGAYTLAWGIDLYGHSFTNEFTLKM